MKSQTIEELLIQVRQCKVCEPELPLGARPILSADAKSKVIIIGQAPGIKVHQSGIPWADQSGDTLRHWLNVDKERFYNPENFAILPMGFCYPGKGKNGDLPPRKECTPLWHNQILEKLTEVKLILLVGQYAQKYYLKEKNGKTLTETVRNFQEYAPLYFPLPHPSPRNFIWMSKNPWFSEEVLPELKNRISELGL